MYLNLRICKLYFEKYSKWCWFNYTKKKQERIIDFANIRLYIFDY